VLDPSILIDRRFTKVDIDARSPAGSADASLLALNNTAFLETCVARFREVSFADQSTAARTRVVRGARTGSIPTRSRWVCRWTRAPSLRPPCPRPSSVRGKRAGRRTIAADESRAHGRRLGAGAPNAPSG
jgi:hypothetical protein